MGVERALKTVEGTAAPECVLLFEGTDFTEPHPLTSEIIKEIQLQCSDDIEVVHSSLAEYFSQLKETLKDRRDLDIVKGPMRDGPAYYPVHPAEMKKPIKAVLMDLDGTTVRSEEFWIWIIEKTVANLMESTTFKLHESDLPFVSGHSVSEHLKYCIKNIVRKDPWKRQGIYTSSILIMKWMR